jgi:hypothetical protein
MLQAHSILWYYLWIAPNIVALGLAFLLWRRGLHREYPYFFAFAISCGVMQLILFVADISPAISPAIWWRIFWADLVIEGLLKFAIIGQIFSHAFSAYSSVAKVSRWSIRGVGIVLILTSALAAALTPQDGQFGIISGAHLLEQTIYLVETGLLATVFLLSMCFHLRPVRQVFGIALGLSVSACVHLATWAIISNGGLPNLKRVILDFANMGTYHVCVLIWFYYLLLPERSGHSPLATKPAIALPENNLALWNRELERLLHQ